MADTSVVWYESSGGGDPVFTQHLISTAAGGSSLAIGDLDGDGDLDVLSVSEDSNTLVWHVNDGEVEPRFTALSVPTEVEGFASLAIKDMDGEVEPSFTAHSVSTEAEGLASLAIKDIDGDGDMDIALVSESGAGVQWYENDGSAVPAFAEHTIPSTLDKHSGMHIEDVDGDGDLDVTTVSVTDNIIAWYENSGTGAPAFREHIVSAASGGAASLAVADLNGDGDMELMSASPSLGAVTWRSLQKRAYWIKTGEALSVDESAIDEDGNALSYRINKEISNNIDASFFSVDPETGVIVFSGAPGPSTPGDHNGDNVYEVWISVTDGYSALNQPIAVHVFDDDDDDDNDGVPDSDDTFPFNSFESLDTDGNGIGDNEDMDDDGDGVKDSADAFPVDASESIDTDRDGTGDNADTDDDGDGVEDSADAFPLDADESFDTDGDGTGNNSDTDDDGDGVEDSADAFPLDADESFDTDGDGTGNNSDTDDDGDGVEDSADAFPLDADESFDTDGDGTGNNSDTDDDGDGVEDSADAFPLDAEEFVDTDGDGTGNNSDTDDDGDGVEDSADAFPLDAEESVDTDGDGTGNNSDTDDDGDGVEDSADAFPLDAEESVDTDGDGTGNNSDTDDDGDGVEDRTDDSPLDAGESLDTDGDGLDDNTDTDDDGDGVEDSADAFPLDAKESVDTDSDGVGNNADTDDDGDGVEDSADAFPLDAEESVDTDSDGVGNNADLDDDGDGVEDSADTFPLDAEEFVDTDGDGTGNNSDTDDDGDGVEDSADAFPLDAEESVDTDGDGVGNNADPDDDGDGVEDRTDDSPLDAGESLDTDGDGVGNNTDTDDDGDGVEDSVDAFPLDAEESVDTDSDGVGNNADTDDDGDGIQDNVDAFPLDAEESVDTDSDGVGNNADSDDDGDSVEDSVDAFPLDAEESVDTDSDGVGNNADTDDDGDGIQDNVDAFPLDAEESVDTDSDGVGNNADTDDDGDGIQDNVDAFPLDAEESVDTDSDGVGNNADTDDDGDGIQDNVDAFPLDAEESVDTDSDGVGNNTDTDDDGDGVPDSVDAFPLDAEESVDTDSDGVGNNTDTDDDGDRVPDSVDAFPLDAEESVDTDSDGVGNNTDTDDDGDGVPDSVDAFPLDASESVDTDGDSIGNNADTDDDGDGVEDSDDAFPLDAEESVDTDSDGVGNNTDTDDDGDGVEDSDDAFPLDAGESVDTDSDGVGNNTDTDDDGDGVPDSDDAFPLDAEESVDTDSDGVGNYADTDDDGDGVPDSDDAFPLDPGKTLATDGDAAPFTNPLFSDGADPWLQWFEGNYYLSTTTGSSQLMMRKSPTLAGLADAIPQYIWSDTIPTRAIDFWAFEFHRLDGPNGLRWYFMYTAGNGTVEGQRLHVLESAGDDPLGPYEFKNTLIPDPWNIDGTYLFHNKQLYLLWSQYVGDDQSIWIAAMSNPWTVDESTAMVLTRPEYIWENGLRENDVGNVGRVNEAPEILQHKGRTFMVYSANTCNGPNYKLGLMELTGDNPLELSDWVKNPEPVFESANGVFGPGHNGFFTSPDGSEDWLVYHGNALVTEGCTTTRSVRAQKIDFDVSGFPIFGEPAAPGKLLVPPAGEASPQIVTPEGMSYRLANQTLGYCVVNGESNTQAELALCTSSNDSWVLDYAYEGYYRLANSTTGEYLKSNSCAANDPTATVVTGSWESTNDCALWSLSPTQNGFLSLTNKHEALMLSLDGCDSSSAALLFDNTLAEACGHWRLEPVGEFAITSLQSGKVFQAEACSADSGASIQQSQWNRSNCQRWTAQAVSDGYLEFSSNINPATCMQLSGDVANPGADIVQGACGSDTALWAIEPLSDGTLKLASASSGHVVDLANCFIGNGVSIGQWEWLDNYCQRFTLKPTASAPVADVDSFLWPVTGDLVSHDPTLEIENEVWYEFHAGPGIPAKISNDRGLSWQDSNAVLESPLDWWLTYVPDHNTADNDVWAPDVHIYNNKVWLYYAVSTFGSQSSMIGLFSSDSLAAGEWVDEGVVISSSPSVDYNAIDPNLFIDVDDEPWLLFGSWWTGIKLTKLDKTTMKPIGDITSLAYSGGGVEGPSLMYRDGYYYLFVSTGMCCIGLDSSYQTRYGRATSITGPYLDKNGFNMLDAGGSLLWFGNSRWIGPGGQDIHNGEFLSFHAYDALDNGTAKLNIAELQWDEDGWPYLVEE